MMFAAINAEPISYSALTAYTQPVKAPRYSAVPPEYSPVEAIKVDRNTRMATHLVSAIDAVAAGEEFPSAMAVSNAVALMHMLPSEMPFTDPYISAVGSVCFDWDRDPRAQLTLTANRNNQIGFAYYLDGERGNGIVDFAPAELPAQVLNAVQRWISYR